MVERVVLVFYAAGAVALGIFYGWEWLLLVLLVGVVPGVALAYLVVRGGEWLSDAAGRLYGDDPDRARRGVDFVSVEHKLGRRAGRELLRRSG